MDLSNALKSHLSNMYRLAMCDEDFDLSEQMLLMQIAEEHGISSEELSQLVIDGNEKPVIPERIEERITHLYDLARIAWADGIVKPEERSMLTSFALRYQFLPENIDDIVAYFLQAVKEQRTIESIIAEFHAP